MSFIRIFTMMLFLIYIQICKDWFLILIKKLLRFSDACSLIGNSYVLKTFPEIFRDKINTVTVSASKLNYIKSAENYVPVGREFLWFFGSGAVHKGLDLVLEVFAKNKDLTLNIVGGIDKERDFCKGFENELTMLPNIKYHGFLPPSSQKFSDIVRKIFCFIAPSCSEGISPSVASCLQLGLFPIISKFTGVDLPCGCGIYLNELSVNELEKTILDVYKMSSEKLKYQIELCQKDALHRFSRERFTQDMTNFINKALIIGKK